MAASHKEDSTLTLEQRRQTLTAAGLLHPHPDLVGATLFAGDNAFFLAFDKVQLKYEMLRAHLVEGVAVVDAAQVGAATAGLTPRNLTQRCRCSSTWISILQPGAIRVGSGRAWARGMSTCSAG